MGKLIDKMVAEAWAAVNAGQITDAQYMSIMRAMGELRREWKVVS